MNDRMVNRLGQRNGDMPRYLLWNENASRTRGSEKNVPRSVSTERCGRSSRNALSTFGRNRSRAEWNGCSRIGRNASSLRRLSAM